MDPAKFIAQVLPAAQALHRSHGIPASFTVAQAALESKWGDKAVGCNLFGVKADSAWHGAVTLVPTHEYINGVKTAATCKFRCYATWAESIADHAEFFRVNPRYAACFKETTGEGWARAVAAAKYATDPNYAAILIDIMHGRKMAQYDQPQGVKS